MARVHSFIKQHALGEFHHESHKYSLSLHNALGKNEKAFDLKDGGLQQQQAAAASNFTFTFSKDFSSGEKRGMGTALDWSNKLLERLFINIDVHVWIFFNV